MAPTTNNPGEPKFNGSNWPELNRLVAFARFQFLQDDDYHDNHERQCAYVAQHFEGPALDWVASVYATSPAVLNNFTNFIDQVRRAFGVADNNITAILRRDLDQLRWSSDVPIFFAEFDRLTLGLGITSHETRIAMVESKLPLHLKKLLSEQALSFANYETMRERFNCMWATDPSRGTMAMPAKKPRCGSCQKKGHTAADCRGVKKN